jgi:hypothetical protein
MFQLNPNLALQKCEQNIDNTSIQDMISLLR